MPRSGYAIGAFASQRNYLPGMHDSEVWAFSYGVHMLVLSGIGSHVIAAVQLGNGMNPTKNFTHLALLGGPPIALVVNADLPTKDIKSFIAYVNAAPQGLSWGSPGLGMHAQLIGELVRRQQQVEHGPHRLQGR